MLCQLQEHGTFTMQLEAVPGNAARDEGGLSARMLINTSTIDDDWSPTRLSRAQRAMRERRS